MPDDDKTTSQGLRSVFPQTAENAREQSAYFRRTICANVSLTSTMLTVASSAAKHTGAGQGVPQTEARAAFPAFPTALTCMTSGQ
jgi:hypothetical protein